MCRALFLPLHRAAFFQASSPACLRTEGRAGAMPALPQCRVICVLPSLCSPTMSPFMRAGMKCEALGINSATGL